MKSPKFVIFGVIIVVLVVLRFMDFGPMVKLFGDPDTYITKGDVYMSEMDYSSAFKEYDKAVTAGENYARAYAKRGDAYRIIENMEMSKADYEKAISLDPNCLDALEGLYFLKLNEFREFGPEDLRTEKYNAYQKERDEMERKIMEACNRLIENNTVDADVYLTRARHYPNRESYKDSIISDLNKAVSLDPNDERVYLNRSYVWKDYGEYDKAITDARKALEINPKSTNAYLRWAEVYEAKKEYDKAIDIYNQGMELANKKGGFLNRIGLCYEMKGDIEKALEYCTKAIESDKTNANFYRSRGHIYQRQEEYELALEDFTTVLNLAPEDKYIRSTIKALEDTVEKNYVNIKIKSGKISEDVEGLWISDTVSFGTGFPYKTWSGKPLSGMPYDLFSNDYNLHGIMIAKDGDTYRVKFFEDQFQAIKKNQGNYINQINEKINQKDGGWWQITQKEMRATKEGNTLVMSEPQMGKISINRGPEQDMSIKLTLTYDANAQTLKITNLEEKQGDVVISPQKTNFEYKFSPNHTFRKMEWNEYLTLKKDIWNKGIEKVKAGRP